MNNHYNLIKISEPLSPLWNCIDNKPVRWLNRKADWILPAAATAAYLVGFVTLPQAAILVIAGKALSISFHFLIHRAHVANIQSNFNAHEIKTLKDKVLDETANTADKYRLGQLLYERALKYDFEGKLVTASPGHWTSNKLTHFIRSIFRYNNSEFYAYAINCKFNYLLSQTPDGAIGNDIYAASELFHEVSQEISNLQADAIYKYGFLLIHRSFILKEDHMNNETPRKIMELKQIFDALAFKGNYEPQMIRLANVLDIRGLCHLNWHHPKETLSRMQDFGSRRFDKLSDVCKTCSHNIVHDHNTVNAPGFPIPPNDQF